jgi:hypothetical protein
MHTREQGAPGQIAAIIQGAPENGGRSWPVIGDIRCLFDTVEPRAFFLTTSPCEVFRLTDCSSVISARNLRVCLASQRKGTQSCRAVELELSGPRQTGSIELTYLHIGQLVDAL